MALEHSNELKIEEFHHNFTQVKNEWSPFNLPKSHYLKTILEISQKYLEQAFSETELREFYQTLKHIQQIKDTKIIIEQTCGVPKYR